MTATAQLAPAAIYVAFAGDHIRKWSREPFEGSTAFHPAQPGAEALRAALAKVLPSGDDRAPGERVIPFYIRMDELRALRHLVAYARQPGDLRCTRCDITEDEARHRDWQYCQSGANVAEIAPHNFALARGPRANSTPQRMDPEVVEADGLAAFSDYFVRNYPGPDTVIHNPHWHAPRIFRAAVAALALPSEKGWREERERLRAALKLAISHTKHMAAWIGDVQMKQREPYGYSFESLGEDMPSIEAALANPQGEGDGER